MKPRMFLSAAAILLAASLAAIAADEPASKSPAKPALEPHPVNRTFYVSGVTDDEQVKKITEAISKLPSVTAVTEMTPTSGYVRVAFDTHKIASHLVAQAIMDQGPFTVTLKFQVPEYKDNAEKLDALFAKVGQQRHVKIEPTDKEKGDFTLTYLPIQPDPNDPRKVGFNYGHLGHPIHDPPPKGLGLTYKQIEQPGGAPAKKGKGKKS
jgi:hypothetical protein